MSESPPLHSAPLGQKGSWCLASRVSLAFFALLMALWTKKWVPKRNRGEDLLHNIELFKRIFLLAGEQRHAIV